MNEFDILIRDTEKSDIVKKVVNMTENIITLDQIISNDTPFGIASNPKTSKKSPFKVYEESSNSHNTLIYHIENGKRKVEYIDGSKIIKNKEFVDKEKVFIPGASGSGNDNYILGKPEYAP